MKTLIVSHTFYPEIGAAPSRLKNMADGLRDRGVEVDVLTALPNYPKGRIFEGYRHGISKHEIVDGIEVFRYWMYATVSKKSLARAWNMVSFGILIWLFAFRFRRIRRYDNVIIQSPQLFSAYSATVLFKCLYGKKVILNISDLWPSTAVELGAMSEGGTSFKVMSYFERFMYRHCDAVFAQSEESLDIIRARQPEKKFFLYRNLQRVDASSPRKTGRNGTFKIVYAGLLGVAQEMFELVSNVDFKALGVEFHIYGGGNQAGMIKSYAASGERNVFYHGFLEKSKMPQELVKYDASIVPLTMHITGAVPSKIFDLMPLGLPIIFSGGGEGEDIVKKNGLGFVSAPRDYDALAENISRMAGLPEDEYMKIVSNCLSTAASDFNFDVQMDAAAEFLRQ